MNAIMAKYSVWNEKNGGYGIESNRGDPQR